MIGVVALILGFATFLAGFFPQKTVIPGFNNQVAPVEPKFSKLVFMVVDALRSDLMFDTSAQMPNVHALINSGYALPFTGYANPPTVTLPRLKGITTGGAPSFLDAVLNIAEGTSGSPIGDSWIHQLSRHNKTMHMYGDDTWLKLFPNVFTKVEGTSSFFVNDYTEVDNNVTRHVAPSLENQDWDVLILHYLGLDHIGHKGGPNSPLMAPKQKEMDGIIQQIFQGIDQNTLFIVTGDHGMNDVGNHGGSSPGETSAALLFLAKDPISNGNPAPILGNNFEFYQKVPQIDLVPTISMLLGLPVPQNSLGLPIKSLVDQQEYMCNHFSKLLNQKFECSSAKLLELQDEFMRASTEYNQKYMIIGIVVTASSALLSLYGTIGMPIESKAPWIAVSALYSMAMFGSSTIEEEHQFWYWGLNGIVLACVVLKIGAPWRWGVAMIALRLLKSWHSCGQKWIGPESYSISSYLYDHPSILWSLVSCTYIGLSFRFENDYLGLVALFFSALFKLNSAVLAEYPLPFGLAMEPIPVYVLIYRVMIGLLILRTVSRRYKFNPALDLFLITQSRLVDIPMFLIYWSISALLPKGSFIGHEADGSLLNIALQYASFFAAGGSNSLATIDLSNAYNGISSYNIPAVSFLTFVSNWVGPIYWAANGPRGTGWRPLYLLFYTMAGTSIILACYLLQDHLFVWTVFSPKLLYFGAWIAFTVLDSLCTQ